MTVHTQIWRECGQCGWSQGIDIHIVGANLEYEPNHLPRIQIEAYLGNNAKVGAVSSPATNHVCAKSHNECMPPTHGGCQHGSLDCPSRNITVYD